MISDSKDSFISQHGKYLTLGHLPVHENFPFKQHPQFPVLTDILNRKHKHHAVLYSDYSHEVIGIYLRSLLHYFAAAPSAQRLRDCDILLLNLDNVLVSDIKQIAVEKEFEMLAESLQHSDKYLIIAIARTDLFSKDAKKSDERFLRRQLETLLSHPKCRVVMLAHKKDYIQHQHLDELFSPLTLNTIDQEQALHILKLQRHELEHYHQIAISDDLLNEALRLTNRYLTTTQTLEKALLLLDSSAARLSAHCAADGASVNNTALTTDTLHQVLADWIRVPANQFQPSFRHLEFTHGLQQRVFGQDAAITLIGQELLQSHAQLRQRQAPFASFLFAGAKHTGKKTAALGIAKQLLRQADALYIAQSTQTVMALHEIKLQNIATKQFHNMTDVMQQTPYAILLFDHAQSLAPSLRNGIQEVISTGLYHDPFGNQHDFRQSIIILCTTVGETALVEFSEPQDNEHDQQTMDLMQLVLNDRKQNNNASQQFSTHEMIEKIMPDITERFTLSFCQHLHVVPFIPLSRYALERIMRLKLKILDNELQARHGVELGYAAEVIRYLIQEARASKDGHAFIDPNRALKQLYFSVEQALLGPRENAHANQLFLQLNETGHLLRCDWLSVQIKQAM